MGKVSSKKITSDFIDKVISEVGLKAEIEVTEEQDTVMVKINGENLGALIGFHGETLESLQLITALVLNQKLKEEAWKRVVVDIGNWRTERTSTLNTLISNSVQEMSQQKLEKMTLPAMSPSQRREIHLIVAEKFPEYESASDGEEPNRRVILFKKS